MHSKSLNPYTLQALMASVFLAESSLNKCNAATIWSGGTTDLLTASNWTNGAPTISNPGTIGGTFTVDYSSNSALNNKNLTLTSNSTLQGNSIFLSTS